MHAARLVGVIGLLFTTACATTWSGPGVDHVVRTAVDQAAIRQQQGDAIEAFQLASAALGVDPDDAMAQAIVDDAPAEYDYIFNRPFLGSNAALRERVPAGVLAHVLWYLPDRILDVLDVVSFDVHFGPGLFADVHATRALQASAGLRSVAGIGWHDHRSLGVQTQAEAGANILFFGGEAYAASLAGTSGVRAGGWALALHTPGQEIYQDYRDYWAVGGGATAAIVGVDVDVHPVQIVDLVLGLFTIDILNDDFAHTEGIDLSSHESQLVKDLGEIATSRSALRAYQAFKEQQAAGGADTP